MKKALLAVVALSLLSTLELRAQCNPNLSMTNPGIAPDSATGLDHAVVNQFYTDTLQFRVPPDTTVIYLGNPVTFTVNWIRIDNVIGLPPGFTWSTTECGTCALHSFNGNTNGCVLIQGTAPATAGTYPLQFALTGNGTHIIIGTISIPDTNSDYRIVVDPQAGIQTYNANVFDVLQNAPNPFNAQTEIAFTVPTAGKVDFRVYDILGKEMITRNIDAVSGLNKVALSSRYFKPGIYFYKVNYKNKSLTRKMIVTAKP